jgi:hypothetical protein
MAAITADAVRRERATNNKVVETIAITTSNSTSVKADGEAAEDRRRARMAGCPRREGEAGGSEI